LQCSDDGTSWPGLLLRDEYLMVCDGFAELIARSPLYISPELNGLSSFEPAAHTARRVRSTFALGAKREDRQLSSETSDVELRDLAYLNLDLPSHQLDGQAVPLDGDTTLPAAATVNSASNEDPVDHDAERSEPTPIPASEESENHATPRANLDDVIETAGATSANESDQTVGEKTSHASFHLSKMRISEQLRSMSQLSGPSDDSDRLTPEAWTFHRRERSNCFMTVPHAGSNRSRYMHHTSDSGIDSAQVPASWGQVTKDPDASSSIHSRTRFQQILPLSPIGLSRRRNVLLLMLCRLRAILPRLIASRMLVTIPTSLS
jgi:hypothetical protein